MSPAPNASTDTRTQQRDTVEAVLARADSNAWLYGSAVEGGFSRDYAQAGWNVQGRWVG